MTSTLANPVLSSGVGPKQTSLARLIKADCDRIATKLNNRPRKRLGFRTPAECYELISAT